MNTITKVISFGILFAFSHLASAESLYASKVQPRLLDEDRDGVIAARDLCPDTPIGSAVDNNGCPSQITKLLSVELKILFDSGKADIHPRFYPELKDLAVFLRSHPKSTVVIEGHTDDRGSEELNKILSQKRASAIADVLVDSFRIKSERVKGIGYGESRPISSNDTEAGREKNRRVVAEVLAEQQFASKRWTIYSVDTSANTALNNK
ncbi:OmpA family protein [Marinomonas sp. GJ51-6]|uniref:OmpA family protein n=1 Tax=Marinomonas sp. GJ51-6 TaxID=2992802 RepID=UPI0029347B01|nr:OmpA family protein [Marinomonas sp. GJ51-6]WOD07487.1 OmpA family protein [Marinomonas sp. GJ51-6]